MQEEPSYEVSARKYRPKDFDSLIGQDNIARTLKNSILRGQLAHAYLFCGPRGVGKTTTARIFAKMINCSNPGPDMTPCGECESCRSFAEGRSYCIHELDAASNNGVDDIKALIDQVRVPPQVGKYSVYIIDEVHMLSQAAFNAFLKTLEEPPAYAKFILATTEKHKILPTILSRCQVYDFKRITEQDMVKHLQYVAEQEQITAEEDALRLVAAKADGALRDALSIFDQLVTSVGKELTYQKAAAHLNVLDQENYFRITDFVFSDNVSDALLLLDDILAKGFDGQKFISGLSTHFRNLLMSMNPATLPLLEMSDAAKMQMRQQAQKCDRTLLIRALELTNQCDLNYKDANNKRLTIELCLMQINANYVYKKVRQSRERK